MRALFCIICFFLIFVQLGFAETRLFPQNSAQESQQESQSATSETKDESKKELEELIEAKGDAKNIVNEELPNGNSTLNKTQEENLLPNAVIEKDKNTEPKELESLKENVDSNVTQNETQKLTDDYFNNLSLAKNVYLEVTNPLVGILYVNQIVTLELKMLVFSKYTTITTEFIIDDKAYKDSVEVLNPNESWVLDTEDSSLRNTFYLKIKQTNYTIPQVKVRVDTNDGEAVESVAKVQGRAIKLERKGEFSQVLAQNLEILETKITSYDTNSNLIVFQLQSTMGNLFDFHLESFKKQGIESKSGDYKSSEAFYYAIVPKDLSTIRFDYFNTKTSKYTELQVENIAIEDRVSTQSDIKPKNNYQFFKISLILFFLLLFLGLYFYKRRLIFIVFVFFALSALVYILTLKTSVILKSNVSLRIQPTFNSTIVLTTQSPTPAEIIGSRTHYYKVILKDDRIGWVRRDDVQN